MESELDTLKNSGEFMRHLLQHHECAVALRIACWTSGCIWRGARRHTCRIEYLGTEHTQQEYFQHLGPGFVSTLPASRKRSQTPIFERAECAKISEPWPDCRPETSGWHERIWLWGELHHYFLLAVGECGFTSMTAPRKKIARHFFCAIMSFRHAWLFYGKCTPCNSGLADYAQAYLRLRR